MFELSEVLEVLDEILMSIPKLSLTVHETIIREVRKDLQTKIDNSLADMQRELEEEPCQSVVGDGLGDDEISSLGGTFE